MGFKFQKRVNLSKGVGLNISKSGVSPSLRTKCGSLSSKGYSVRTGITGLSYRGNNKNAMGVIIVIGIVTIGFIFIRWLIRKISHVVFRRKVKVNLLHGKNP